jgi:hypothetical protein
VSFLSGVTVIEVANVITGPYAGVLLADLGADVIKVEAPGGDRFRRWQAESDEIRSAFAAYNRGNCYVSGMGSLGPRPESADVRRGGPGTERLVEPGDRPVRPSAGRASDG